MNKQVYVVSLNRFARRDDAQRVRMYEVLSSTAGVDILEGAQRKTTKVQMPASKVSVLEQALPDATVSRYQDLDLLATR